MTLKACSDYSRLKDQVLLSIGTSEQYNQMLSALKELFSKDIKSPRRLEKITTIRELLNVLEVRDVLSENNITPLKAIAQQIPNSHELSRYIEEYEASQLNRASTESVNCYEKPTSTQNRGPVESYTLNSSSTGMSNRKKERIIETIVDDIGTYWRDLARMLNIKEKVIDDLNKNYKESMVKARAIMELYGKKADQDSNVWFFDLCEALETCRRKDLAKEIKKIALMNL